MIEKPIENEILEVIPETAAEEGDIVPPEPKKKRKYEMTPARIAAMERMKEGRARKAQEAKEKKAAEAKILEEAKKPKRKPAKKSKKQVVIYESGSSSSEEENQVIIRRKNKKRRPRTPSPPPYEPEYNPEPEFRLRRF